MLICLSIILGVALEGEVTLVAAAFAANRGLLSPNQVFIAALVGTLIADWTCFFIGRLSTSERLPFKNISSKRLAKILLWMSEKRLLLIFSYRYFYGARTAILLLFGHSPVTTAWFLTCSTIAILLWTSLIFTIGYFLGEAIAHYMPYAIKL